MQELVEVLLKTKETLSKQEDFKDYEYKLSVDAIIDLLNNAYELETTVLSHIFDYGFLQAELKNDAEVTSGSEYIKKFYKKDENISS